MKSTFTRKTQFMKKNRFIFAFRHAGGPLPCSRPQFYFLSNQVELVIIFENFPRFGISVISTPSDQICSENSENNLTLIFRTRFFMDTTK